MFGRQAEQFQSLTEGWGQTLSLLRDLKDGKIKLEQLVLEKDGWHLTELPAEEASE